MANWNLGGTVNNTSGYSGYWPANPGNYVYTNGYGMPTARVDLLGNTPIYLGTIYAAYTSGPLNGIQMVYQTVLTAGGTVFPTSGGTAQLRFLFTGGGTLYFGRNTTNGLVTIANRSGGPGFTGGLVGSVDWGQVPTAPQSLSVVAGPGSGQITASWVAPLSNGDVAISGYTVEYATSLAGPWTSAGVVAPSILSATIAPPPGFTYYMRVYANNLVGSSVAAANVTPVAPVGGGKRFNGAAFAALTVGRRYTGAAWLDLVTRKRFDGVNWVNIT